MSFLAGLIAHFQFDEHQFAKRGPVLRRVGRRKESLDRRGSTTLPCRFKTTASVLVDHTARFASRRSGHGPCLGLLDNVFTLSRNTPIITDAPFTSSEKLSGFIRRRRC